MGVGAGVIIVAGLYYQPSAAPKIFGMRPATSEAINGLMPLVDKALGSKEEIVTTPPLPVSKPASIFFAGDIMLGRSVAEQIAKNGNDYPFAKIKDTVASADYAIANLEGPLTKTNNAPSNRMRFHFNPALGPAIVASGFDAFSLANNHGLDQGTKGFVDGEKNLADLGLGYFGNASGDDGTVLHFKIGENNFAALGAQDVYRKIDTAKIGATIAAEKAAGNFVIVYPHWGEEYKHDRNARQVELAHAFVDAGADVVVGMHPHVVQGIEIYKGKTIFYSLGNLIFDQYFSVETQQGLALKMNIDVDKKVVFELLPYEIPKSQPVFVGGEKKIKMLSDLASWSIPELKEQIVLGLIKF